jgi:phage shock protein E
MPRLALLAALPLLALAYPAAAAPPPTPSHVDYGGFVSLSQEIARYRAQRLVHLDAFQKMAGEGGTLILDARSANAYAAGHIDGAVNLPFTDFTAQSLAAVIGHNPNRRILIYCNNNFANDAPPVMLKSVRLALNIQTFINLYGYGYRNVWELADTVDFNDPEVRWVKGAVAGSAQAATVEAMKPPPSTRDASPAS